jgi:adenosylhomocysteine nucleosidase
MIIDGVSILTLIAAKSEYGTAMKAVIPDAEIIGVGPVEAAFNTTKILMDKKQQKTLPDIIFSIGTAGSSTLNQADLYQISSVSYRDMNASAFGFEKGVTPWVDYPAMFALPILFDDVPTASLSTGGAVIDKQGSAGVTFDDIQADCVDMETYSIARVGYDFKIPLIGLRGISDGKEDSSGVQTWEQYLVTIDEKIANFYKRVLTETASLMRIISEEKKSLY